MSAVLPTLLLAHAFCERRSAAPRSGGLVERQIGDQATSARLSLKLRREPAGVDEHAVDLDQPRERVVFEQLASAELGIHAAHETEGVADLLRLSGHRARGYAEQFAEAIGAQVRLLAGIKEEVVGADRVDRAGGPDPQVAASERRGTLARELGHEPPR